MRTTCATALFALACFTLWCAAQSLEIEDARTGLFPAVADSNQFVVIQWPADAGVNYQVQVCTDDWLMVWTSYTNVVCATNGMMSQQCFVSGTNATFRVMR